jgi:hypothetical protein
MYRPVNHFLLASGELINKAFKYILPEFPKIGTYLVILCVVLFTFYLCKSGLKHATKISLIVFIAFVFVLFSAHVLGKALHLL